LTKVIIGKDTLTTTPNHPFYVPSEVSEADGTHWLEASAFCLSFCVFGQADSSTVHGLRELAGDAFKTTDHTGFPNKSLEELKKAAQDLKDILPATFTGFKVFDYGSYPMLKYMGKINMDSTLFLAMQQEIEKTTQNYLLIGKHIDPRTGEVSFKVKLKLPTSGNKGGSNPNPIINEEDLIDINFGVNLYLNTESAFNNNINQGVVKGIEKISDFLNDKPIREIYSINIPKGYGLLSPTGRIVKTPDNATPIKYSIDIEKSVVISYSFQENGKTITLDRLAIFSDNTEAFSGSEYLQEPNFITATPIKVIKFVKNSTNRCFCKLYEINWSENDFKQFPNSLNTKIGVYLSDINVCDPANISDAVKKKIQN
jgi:hypothetical protein